MSPTHDSMKKVCILLSSVLGGVMALILILLLALAPVAEYVINHYGPEIVGREATVGKVRINPLRAASVSVYDFHLKEQNELTDFAAFDTLYVDMNLFALMHKEVYLRQVTVKNFTGEVLRTNDRFNFTDIIEHFQTPDSLRQESDSTPSAWKISLRNIDIIRSRVEYRDVIRDDRWELNDININIPGLYFGGNRASNAGITFQFQRGGSVGIMADYTMATNAFSVHLHMDSVSADVAQPFVRPMLNIQSLGGTVSGDLSADGNLSRPSDTRLGGWVSLDSIRIESESGDCPLAFRRLYAALGSINLETMHFDLDTIVLSDLTVGYTMYGENDNTLSRLLVADSTYQEADTIASDRGTAELDIETTHRELYLTVKLAQIQNAAVHYHDVAMSPEFAYQISNLNAKAFHLSNHASNQVKLTANVGSRGRLEGHYQGDLDIAKGRENLDLMLLVASALRALGDSKTPLYFLIFSSCVNVVMDLTLVIGFKMGVAGVAMATIISQYLSATIAFIYARKYVPYFRISKEELKPDYNIIRTAFKLGVPLALQSSLIAISCMVLQGIVNGFGKSVMTAYTITGRVEQLVQQPYGSIGIAVMTFAGQNMGANKIDRVKKGFKETTFVVLVFSLILIPIMFLLGKPIAGIFVKDAEIIYIAATGLKMTSIFYFPLGMIYVPRSLCNGCGDSMFAMINGITEVFCRVFFSEFFVRMSLFGYWSIWVTTACTWSVTAIVCIGRYMQGKWKKGRLSS